MNTIDKQTALLVIDMQYDFIEGGTLAVPDGLSLKTGINEIIPKFKHVIFTQDYHPADHISFFPNHEDKKVQDVIETPYGNQILWPEHCVMGSPGADIIKGVGLSNACLILRKGMKKDVDSYSAFLEADKTPTGLGEYLAAKDIVTVFVVGLTLDFCVNYTALDSCGAYAFDTTVVTNLCKGVDLKGDGCKEILKNMCEQGVQVVESL